MYIRRTSIKSRRSGEPYYTYRIVETFRTKGKVRQQTLLNLGRHFDIPREQWASLVQRIGQILQGNNDLFPLELDQQFEQNAQRYAALMLTAKACLATTTPGVTADYHNVDIASMELVRPRSVGVEHVALSVLQQSGLESKLEALGFTGPGRQAALGSIIARMVNPGSELATHRWLQECSGLGELINADFGRMSLMQLYRISDKLYTNKAALESFLYQQAHTLFEFDEVITLYDLTNTYFEGSGKGNANAAYGRSKEKRSDCPLVTLALVLDGSGFVKKSEIFPGNASEPQTLEKMIHQLAPENRLTAPTVVLDAGIATEENIAWLVANHYRYVVVSRKRHRQFDDTQARMIKETSDNRIKIQRVVCPSGDEVELYCHSEQREKKENGIQESFARRFEEALEKLSNGLHKKRTKKKHDYILVRIGRLKQKYARAAQYYEIRVEEGNGLATKIHWKRTKSIKETLPGVYCLRTNQTQWDDATLWHTYTMLTDLESVFRCLKAELGLRPVFHHKTHRVSGHLFISVLAYHLVHTIRFQLKASGIHLSWNGIRRELMGQNRVTVQLNRADGKTLHVRKTTRAEPRQKLICDALGILATPGRTEQSIIEQKTTSVVP